MKFIDRAIRIAGTMCGMAAVVSIFQLVACAGKAYAQSIAPGATPNATDANWSLIEQYGPIWGGMALAFALGSWFLRKNESTHWIAQGRTLAIIMSIVGTGTAALTARLAGAPWPGVLITAVVSLFKLLQPTVTPVPVPVPTAPSKSTTSGTIGMLALLILGAGLAPACGGNTPKPKEIAVAAGDAVIHCVKADAGPIAVLIAELGADALGSALHVGGVDFDGLVDKAVARGKIVGGCAGLQFLDALRRTQPATAVRALVPTPNPIDEAEAKLRARLGGGQWDLSNGTVQ